MFPSPLPPRQDNLPIQESNKTECACLMYADRIAPKPYQEFRKEVPVENYVKVFPFDSAKKRMQTIIQVSDLPGPRISTLCPCLALAGMRPTLLS
jgi:Ca2+ transporting ATPase